MTQTDQQAGRDRPGNDGNGHGKIDSVRGEGASGGPGAQSPVAADAGSRSTLLQTFKAVGSALFGVRSASGHRTDMSRLNPVHVILAGLLAAAVFVGLLIFFAKMMLRASGAA